MATFGALRQRVLAQARAKYQFAFMRLGASHEAFWEELNSEECKRGYVKGEYEKPGTPGLCDMDLLTDAEMTQYLERAAALSQRH